jgi:hypothetical protein
MVSTSKPIFFGVPPASATSFPGAMVSRLQSSQPGALQASVAARPLGQALSNAAEMATMQGSTAGFSCFSSPLTNSTKVITSQPTLTVGITTTPAFQGPFDCDSQSRVGVRKAQQQEAPKPALALHCGSTFPFVNSGAPGPPAVPGCQGSLGWLCAFGEPRWERLGLCAPCHSPQAAGLLSDLLSSHHHPGH